MLCLLGVTCVDNLVTYTMAYPVLKCRATIETCREPIFLPDNDINHYMKSICISRLIDMTPKMIDANQR